MPRQKGSKIYADFSRGLITESTELTFPENATSDELNCDLPRKGGRTRRKGIEFENSYTYSAENLTTSSVRDDAIATGTWRSVAGNGRLNFIVVQVGSKLYFYDAGSIPLSAGLKSFTLNLATYKAPGASNPKDSRCDFASGKGWLFVVSADIDPIYVAYDETSDTITAAKCNLEIRDLDGLDDGLEVDERPTTLSTEHKYNIFNQGWYVNDVRKEGGGSVEPYSYLRSQQGIYPSNADVWWTMKGATGGFAQSYYNAIPRGSAEAPKGHYIVDPFYIDRSAVSGISGISVESTTSRPVAVAFYAGRAWWGGQKGTDINGSLYYTQLLEDESKIGKCYQNADPVSEDINQLVDTDGGVLIISDIGNVLKMQHVGSSLIIFATNGVWEISGPDGYFKASDFFVKKISSIGASSPQTIIDVDSIPIWWGETGIFSLARDQVSQNLNVVSLSDDTIKEFYQDIPALSRLYAQGIFDSINRRVIWMYSNEAPTDGQYRFKYNRVLNFDVDKKAFFPWTVGELAADSPWVAGVVILPTVNEITQNYDVVDDLDEVIASANEVVAQAGALVQADNYTKYLTVVLDGATYELVWSEFKNNNLLDWEVYDGSGVSYSSYLVTGFELFGDAARFKQAPWIYTHLKENDDFGNYGCLLQGRWDFATSTSTAKRTTTFQIYRDVGNDVGVLNTRHKFRGKGRALQLHFKSDGNKDFNILGWTIFAEINREE